MDMKQFQRAFDGGEIHKVHIDFIIEEKHKLQNKLDLARQALLAVRDCSYRKTGDATAFIDETLKKTGKNNANTT